MSEFLPWLWQNLDTALGCGAVGFALILWIALAIIRARLIHVSETRYNEGYEIGHMHGRRCERLNIARDSALDLPPGQDAHYPMITERDTDGTIRRLDR